MNLKRIEEGFFVESTKIGSLRLEKGYLLAAPANAKKRTADGMTKSSAESKSAKPAPKKKTGDLIRPRIDKLCPIQEDGQILLHGGVFWDAMLALTDIGNNNNKYYVIQLIECHDGTYAVWNRWGRHGFPGQIKLFDDLSLAQAQANFSNKFSDKTHNKWSDGRDGYEPYPGKYTWLEMDPGEDEDEEESKPSAKKPAPLNRPGAHPSSKMDVDGEEEEEPKKTSLTTTKPSAVVCSLDPRVADLVQMLFDNTMMAKTVAAMNYDVKKQPLGKLSKQQIKKALGILKEVEDLLTSGKYSQAKISDLSNRFYTFIPHGSGKTRLPYLDNLVILEEKLNLLDTLNEIDTAQKLNKEDTASGDAKIHPLDRHYSQLNLKLTPLDRNSDTWKILETWVKQTHAPTHTDYKLKILDIFEVDRPKDRAQFVAYEGLHNQQLLWHGSRMSNWVGILSQGLRIAPPEAPVTGYMFGKGVYFADIVSKSANYCATSAADNIGFMMACQVALGDTYDKTAAEFVKDLPKQFQSCRGIGLTQPNPKEAVTLPDGAIVPSGKLAPSDEVAHSDLLYNEFIVYDVAQIKFRYFFKFQFMYK